MYCFTKSQFILLNKNLDFCSQPGCINKTQINKNKRMQEFGRERRTMKITQNLNQKLYLRNTTGNFRLTTTCPILSYQHLIKIQMKYYQRREIYHKITSHPMENRPYKNVLKELTQLLPKQIREAQQLSEIKKILFRKQKDN